MASNDPSDVKLSELNIENKRQKDEITALQSRVVELETQLKTANDVIEAEVKSKIATRIMATSKYTIEDLSRMNLDEIQAVDKVLGYSNAPYKSIRTKLGGDTKDEGLTVGDLSVVTANKKKEGR